MADEMMAQNYFSSAWAESDRLAQTRVERASAPAQPEQKT
jgi:hypothetical protein